MSITKKTGLIIVAVLFILAVIILILGLNYHKKPPPETNLNQNLNLTNINDGGILPVGPPSTNGHPPIFPPLNGIQKEKLFVSAYFDISKLDYDPQIPSYNLPLENIKEDVINYRDFSRKIPLTSALDNLKNDGFAVVKNPLNLEVENLENFYQKLQESKVPIIVTADSLIFLYNFTINSVYKEIEEETFYNSLWQLTKNLFETAKIRYEEKYRTYGIQYDLIGEASRLELAYFAVALELLKPKSYQIKDILTESKRYFNSKEALNYQFTSPAYLENEISQEINLIENKRGLTISPLFLYPLNYEKFNIPPQYAASEKLKNYYLALNWLENILFPLFAKNQNCPDCLLDQEDLNINFVAAYFLADDLAKNQDLKNQWANIYKTISFFKGLEWDLTYLDYVDVFKKLFGENYNLEELFGGELTFAQENIKKIADVLADYKFLGIKGGKVLKPHEKGLRLLRKNFLPQDYIFQQLTYPTIENYQLEIKDWQKTPFTACLITEKSKYYRCLPRSLDIFNIIDLSNSKEILFQEKDTQYQGYETKLNNLKKELENFDQYTWHDNASWSLIAAFKKIYPENLANYPDFMKNQKWQKKTLNSILGGWTDQQREIILEKTAFIPTPPKFEDVFSYGYLEPLPDFYNELLANIKMIKNGFLDLLILKSASRSFTRLDNLEEIFKQAIEISIKELKNQPLAISDYEFISNFNFKIKGVIGDIIPEARKFNFTTIPYQTKVAGRQMMLNEYLEGLNLLIVVYQTPDSQLFLAAGPIMSYTEGKNNQKFIAEWQKEYLNQ